MGDRVMKACYHSTLCIFNISGNCTNEKAAFDSSQCPTLRHFEQKLINNDLDITQKLINL